jgi:hypothetical protein
MNWKKERDLLISQTMAFVQSVTGKTPDFERASDVRSGIAKSDFAKSDVAKSDLAKSDLANPEIQAAPVVQAEPDDPIKIEATRIEAAKTDARETVAPPVDIQINAERASTEIPRAVFPSDVRTEMQARVANFRAHQERFSREREEYFSSTLTRARAGIRNETAPDPADRTPPNR